MPTFAVVRSGPVLMRPDILPAFNDPACDRQTMRERLRDAVRTPGRSHALPHGVLASLPTPSRLAPGAAALALALLGPGQQFWLDSSPARERMRDWLGWHTGADATEQIAQADVAIARACEAQPDVLAGMRERPSFGASAGATLLIEVPELRVEPAPRRLEPDDAELTPRIQVCGHGMARGHTLAVGGLSGHFWRARAARQASQRFGVDILLVCEDRLCAVPADAHVAVVQLNEALMQ